MRLMNEVYKIADLYLRLQPTNKHIEVHLDINQDINHGSSCVVNEAIGYIKGVCNVVPFVKPESFVASHCADRFKTIKVA